MRILLCTEFYHRLGGGYAFALDSQALLEAHGHAVTPVAAAHPQNLPSPFSPHFVPFESYPDMLRRGQWQRAPQILANVTSNRAAAAAVTRLVRCHRPDLVHTHIIATYLSQSVWAAAKRAGVPVVHTLHDYKLLCPDTHMFTRGQVCEQCRSARYWQCALRRCKRGSLPASILAAAQAYAQRLLRRAAHCVDAFVAPSEFIRRKHVEWGFAPQRIHCIPNFTHLPPRPARGKPGDYFLYAGRLSREKGVETLARAARLAPGVQVLIAGDGELRGQLERTAPRNVQLLGRVPRERVAELLADARALVVPSIWYENCSLSVLEAFAAGVPVIGSAIGGIPEQVEPGRTGLLARPGDAPALAQAMEQLHASAKQATIMGTAARRKAEIEYSPHTHYQRLIALYQSL